MNILAECTYVHHMSALCPQTSTEHVRDPETVVTVGCEPPYRCWEWTQGLLQEQALTAEPSV